MAMAATRRTVDFTAPSGTPVLSVLAGTVVGIRTGSFTGDSNAAGGYGNFVTILHTGGFYATYAHLTTDNVSIGQTVGQGTQIGTSGSTGTAEGAHIHVHFGTGSGGGAINTEGTGDIFRAFGGNDAPPAFFAGFFGVSEVGPHVDVNNASTILSTDIFGTGNWGGSLTTDSDQLRGNSSSNRIFGGGGPDRLYGEGGDDLLVGGTGQDYFDGGLGSDTVSVAYSASNWTINLASNGTATADGITETLVNIENVIGGAGADTITTSSENINNIVDGGDGSDRVILPYVFGQGYSVSGTVANLVISGSAGADTFRVIENFQFSNG
jgi:murein DD-endopeptidase MepM/ murein hydrolase activator NlpD